ncbi:hypothetical protein [Kitasatospora sp. NPDC057223]|uniref:hypothetical protein n=1 Tax=Kitasatospora sp. NPDC057223 TaxID=3346055 RepID=UPI003637E1C7
MTYRKLATAVAAVALTVSGALMTAPVASAATQDEPTATSVEVGLVFKGYDKAVAEAHGYTIKTSPAGFEYSVLKDATPEQDAAAQAKAALRWGKTMKKPGQGVQPIQEDYSDFISPSCGKAWLSGIAVGNLSVDISTGFEPNAGDAAIFYYWNIYLSDAGGTSHQDFGPSGLLERRTWSSHRTVGGLSPSNGRAWIDSSSSYAALLDGAYCYPGPVTVHYGIN